MSLGDCSRQNGIMTLPTILSFFGNKCSIDDLGKMLFAFLVIFIIISAGLVFLFVIKLATRRNVDLNGKHVLITGGSSGIGKELACEAVRRGAHVTIVARNQHKLDLALQDLFEVVTHQQQRIQTISLDVSKNYKEMKEKINGAEILAGPVFMLINCAGMALCGTLDDVDEDQIRNQFEVNTIGSILPTKAVLSSMKEQKDGHIVLVASQAAYCGIYGFTAYSGSKFALRGFAEALSMELEPYNVKVTVAYPPDTDTPGFQEEQKTKPKETRLISDTSGLYDPKIVAKTIISHALDGKFASNMGIDGFMLEHLCCGMSPMDSLFDTAIQMMSLNLFRCLALGYGLFFRMIVRNCHQERLVEEMKKQQEKPTKKTD